MFRLSGILLYNQSRSLPQEIPVKKPVPEVVPSRHEPDEGRLVRSPEVKPVPGPSVEPSPK